MNLQKCTIPLRLIGACSNVNGKVNWSTHLPGSEGSLIRSTPSESGSALFGLLKVPGTLQLSGSAQLPGGPDGFGTVSCLTVVEALSIGPSFPTLITLVRLFSCVNSQVNFFAKLLNGKHVVLTQLPEYYWVFMSFHHFWVNWPYFEKIEDKGLIWYYHHFGWIMTLGISNSGSGGVYVQNAMLPKYQLSKEGHRADWAH